MKSLDAKLAEIKANPATRAFIIADAKDADMAFGRSHPESHVCIFRIRDDKGASSRIGLYLGEFGIKGLHFCLTPNEQPRMNTNQSFTFTSVSFKALAEFCSAITSF